jgi:hypothetical protein
MTASFAANLGQDISWRCNPGPQMRPRGTISSRSPGSHRIRISLGRDPITGKRRFSVRRQSL